jgi:uncharacterized protein YuzE
MSRPSKKNRLSFQYDHLTDVLFIASGHPVNTDSVGLDENVIMHTDPQTGAVVGFSILDFTKRFVNQETPAVIPLTARFERLKQRRKSTRTGSRVSTRQSKTSRSVHAGSSHNQ